MFVVTPRLKSIISLIEKTNTAVDIGCDHAYTAIKIIDENRAKKVIACDIKKGPLKIAQQNIKKYKKEDKIETRLGNGLSIIENGEADTIIIAGMGGELIEDILKKDIQKAKDAVLILQPMNAQEILRKWLIQNGFFAEKEDIAIEGFKVYNIMRVKYGKTEPFEKEIHYHIPPYLREHKNYTELYNKKKREFEKIIKGLKKAKEEDKKKLLHYENLLKELEEM